MKRAVILHGTGSSPEADWHPWLRRLLVSNGYVVLHPQLPNQDRQNRFINNDYLFSQPWNYQDNLIIGHSSGSTTVLNLLADERCPDVKAVVLIGAYVHFDPDFERRLGFDPSQFEGLFDNNGFNKDVILQKCPKILLLHGDDDPLCPLSFVEKFSEAYGGKLRVVPGGKHLRGESLQEIPELEELLADEGIL